MKMALIGVNLVGAIMNIPYYASPLDMVVLGLSLGTAITLFITYPEK